METEAVMAGSRSSFVNGLAIGFGAGFLTTFIILWTSIFFNSQLSPVVSYEQMISVFIYPLLFFFGIGTVLLTAGIVREYVSPFILVEYRKRQLAERKTTKQRRRLSNK